MQRLLYICYYIRVKIFFSNFVRNKVAQRTFLIVCAIFSIFFLAQTPSILADDVPGCTSSAYFEYNPDATVDLSKQLKEFEQHRAALGNDTQKNASDSDISGTKHTVVKLNCPTSGGVKL